jgi:hypothetical protein
MSYGHIRPYIFLSNVEQSVNLKQSIIYTFLASYDLVPENDLIHTDVLLIIHN